MNKREFQKRGRYIISFLPCMWNRHFKITCYINNCSITNQEKRKSKILKSNIDDIMQSQKKGKKMLNQTRCICVKC